MNPKNLKGEYKHQDSVADNVSLSGPLLSRFDIILLLLDDKQAAWDHLISAHILRSHQAGGASPLHQVCPPYEPKYTFVCHICCVR